MQLYLLSWKSVQLELLIVLHPIPHSRWACKKKNSLNFGWLLKNSQSPVLGNTYAFLFSIYTKNWEQKFS